MKKHLLFYLITFLLLSSSCDKENPTAFSFTHDYAEFTFTVNPTSTQGDIELGVTEIETDIQGLVSDNGVSIDNLNSVKVKAIAISIIDTTGTPYTFNLLNKVIAEINNVNNPTLIEFAKKDPVPGGGLTTLNLDVNNIELLPYFKLSKIKFNLSGFTNAPIDHAFDVKVAVTVKFEGEVIK